MNQMSFEKQTLVSCQGITSRDWYAWNNLMPPKPDDFHIVGRYRWVTQALEPYFALRSPREKILISFRCISSLSNIPVYGRKWLPGPKLAMTKSSLSGSYMLKPPTLPEDTFITSIRAINIGIPQYLHHQLSSIAFLPDKIVEWLR